MLGRGEQRCVHASRAGGPLPGRDSAGHAASHLPSRRGAAVLTPPAAKSCVPRTCGGPRPGDTELVARQWRSSPTSHGLGGGPRLVPPDLQACLPGDHRLEGLLGESRQTSVGRVDRNRSPAARRISGRSSGFVPLSARRTTIRRQRTEDTISKAVGHDRYSRGTRHRQAIGHAVQGQGSARGPYGPR